MKVGGSRPVAGVAPVSGRREPDDKDDKTTSEARDISDTTSIMGIPEADLTPKVRAAIMSLMAEVDRLRQEVETARVHLVQLEQMADQDSLLPVFNRRAFVRELSRVLSFSERYGSVSSVLYFDINSFKAINDTHGHAAGDAALEQVAKTLIEHVRESDIVGRLGGDEFGVILAQSDHDQAQEKALHLATAIRDSRFEWGGEKISLAVAYGIYTFDQGEDARHALEAADKAMYVKKSEMKQEG